MNIYTDEQINQALAGTANIFNGTWTGGALVQLLSQRTAKPAPSFPALPPGEEWHNPDKLTWDFFEGDKGWRPMLSNEEWVGKTLQTWTGTEWSEDWNRPKDSLPPHAYVNSFRTRTPLPENILRWQAEQQKIDAGFDSAWERVSQYPAEVRKRLETAHRKEGDAPCATENQPTLIGASNAEPKSDPSASAPFRITGPGLYRTRDGRKAEVKSIESIGYNYPVSGIMGGLEFTWRLDGSFYLTQNGSAEDLVAHWTEEPAQPTAGEIDWSKVPEGYDWVAMDSNGSWEAYNSKPRIPPNAGYWNNKPAQEGGMMLHIDVPFTAPDWTQSLVQRPAPQPAPDERSSTEKLFEELQQDCPYLFEIPDPKFHDHFQRKRANRDAIREALEYGYFRAKEELNETTSRVSE